MRKDLSSWLLARYWLSNWWKLWGESQLLVVFMLFMRSAVENAEFLGGLIEELLCVAYGSQNSRNFLQIFLSTLLKIYFTLKFSSILRSFSLARVILFINNHHVQPVMLFFLFDNNFLASGKKTRVWVEENLGKMNINKMWDEINHSNENLSIGRTPKIYFKHIFFSLL